MKDMKRIQTVTIKRMYDQDADSSHLGEYSNRPDSDHSIDRDHYEDCPRFWANDDIPDDARECDCRTGRDSRSYQYFNGPVWNYKGIERDELRKYVKQDYDRMESLNNGNWHYIGTMAEARIVVNGVCQTVTSGGLWGTESDSEAAYLEELDQEQLDELKGQLAAIGFNKRAVSTAFKTIKHTNE